MARAETKVTRLVTIHEVCKDCVLSDLLDGREPHWAQPDGDILTITADLAESSEYQVRGLPSDIEVADAFNACEGPVQVEGQDLLRECGAIAILQTHRKDRNQNQEDI